MLTHYMKLIFRTVSSPGALCIIAVGILAVYMVKSSSNFLNIGRVFTDYFAIFARARKQLIVFWGVPLLLAAAAAQVLDITGEAADDVTVFLSILISSFFAMLSILASRQSGGGEPGESEESLYQKVLKETASAVLLEIVLCLFALILSICLSLMEACLPPWAALVLSFIDYYLIFLMLIHVLILIKRFKSLIDNA